jgi:hypothetical protein
LAHLCDVSLLSKLPNLEQLCLLGNPIASEGKSH